MRVVAAVIKFALRFALLMLLLIPLLGPPLYIEIGGETAPGTVIAKREVIQILSGNWSRRLFVDVRYQPTSGAQPVETDIAVDSETYDRLSVGAPVTVHYIPHPTLQHIRNLTTARLDSQLPLASLVARAGSGLLGLAAGVALWLVLLFVWYRRRHWALALALFALMVGGIVYHGTGWPSPAPAGALITTNATIRQVELITRVWESSRSMGEEAAEPYLIVELSFVPRGASEPVIAVDMVDADSVPGLERGMTIPISYSAQNPRWARIDDASRTYYWKNLLGWGILFFMLAVIVLGLWLLNRRKLRRRAAASRL